MKKRFFILIPIIIGLGLVSLALVGAGAANIDKPTNINTSRPVINPASRISDDYTALGFDQVTSREDASYGLSKLDQMRLEVMDAIYAPDVLNRVEFWLNQSSMSYMWGNATPSSVITITTPYIEYITTADSSGDWGTDPLELYPGDQINMQDSLGFIKTINIPDPLEAHADSSLSQVWGQIENWYNQEVEVHRYWNEEVLTSTTDTAGDFVLTDESMPRGAVGYIRYEDNSGPTQIIFHRPFYDIVPGLRVNYAHEWVETDYEPGHTVWLTLTESTGVIKATATGETGMIEWWGGATGFSTGYNLLWSPSQNPDIQPGDWVYTKFDNGYTNQVHLGTIEGMLDVDSDVISGTIYAPWFTQTLGASCGVWVDQGPGMGFEVDPDGGSYECDFGGEFDIHPGMDVGVNYWEPDSDQIINVFHEPAPHLWINTYGQGDAALGGNYVLYVEYNNDGDALAEDVTITATLLNGMTYLGDTSGFAHSGSGTPGDPLVWYLGSLDVNHWSPNQFQIFVHVTESVGEVIDHEMQIETTTTYYQGDPEIKYSYWWGTVVENNTDLNIGKWPWTWDPLPGSEFNYTVNVCSVGSTASTEVTLTDTLPLSTTLLNWWSYQPGWVEVSSSDHELVVSRLSVPSGMCSEVNMRVQLDENAWEGMELVNEATISADNDLTTDNNYASVSHQVGSPHTNLTIWPDWVWGNFVPGGEVNYELRSQNTGNLPVEDVLITSTLPAGTSLLMAYTWNEMGWFPYPPTLITSDYLVWDIGSLEPGYWQNIGIRLQIDPQTESGSYLTHTVEISPQPLEDTYNDNNITWIDRVNDPGPNLSVDKHTNWYWTWEGQLQYELRIRNLGTESLDSFMITDTYPTDTDLSNWWQNHGPMITMTHDADNNMIMMEVDELNPGDTASVMYQLDLDAEIIGDQGLVFTNVVEAPIAGDTNPADNTDTVVAYTGPDVYIEKEITGGELYPGEHITFTVEFGNQNRWPWHGNPEYSSHITDTLMEGMTFITATAPLGGDWSSISIDGNEIVLEWGPMWANSSWTFDIVAEVNQHILGRDTLINTIEAYGDSPDDIELNWDNNIFELRVTQPTIYLPLIPNDS